MVFTAVPGETVLRSSLLDYVRQMVDEVPSKTRIDALTGEILLRSFYDSDPPQLTAILIEEQAIGRDLVGVHNSTEAEALDRIEALIDQGLLCLVTDDLRKRVLREIEECSDNLERLSRRVPQVGGLTPTDEGQAILRDMFPPSWHGAGQSDSVTGYQYFWQSDYADGESACPVRGLFSDEEHACIGDCEAKRGCRVTACGPWWSAWWWRHPTGFLIRCRGVS